MSAPEKIFKGDITKIGAVDIEAPLATAKTPCCDYYMSQYAKAAQTAEEKTDGNAASIYSFLQVITSFYPSFDTPHQPFRPFFQMEDRRGFIPSDLWPEDIAAIKELTKFAKDSTLRSRLFDVLWELTKDHTACAEAAASYIQAGEKLNTPEGWIYAVTFYHRGLYLAAKLGHEKDLFKNALESLLQATRKAATETENFWCCRFMGLLISFGYGDTTEFPPLHI